MPKTCAHPAIENSAEIKMPSNVHIPTGWYIQWECAKIATSQIIIR